MEQLKFVKLKSQKEKKTKRLEDFQEVSKGYIQKTRKYLNVLTAEAKKPLIIFCQNLGPLATTTRNYFKRQTTLKK